jgi:hypothetical protein
MDYFSKIYFSFGENPSEGKKLSIKYKEEIKKRNKRIENLSSMNKTKYDNTRSYSSDSMYRFMNFFRNYYSNQNNN